MAPKAMGSGRQGAARWPNCCCLPRLSRPLRRKRWTTRIPTPDHELLSTRSTKRTWRARADHPFDEARADRAAWAQSQGPAARRDLADRARRGAGYALQAYPTKRCPFCAHDDSQVGQSSDRVRPRSGGVGKFELRRAFTTFERVQLREVTVVQSGDRQPFERSSNDRSRRLPQARCPTGTHRPAGQRDPPSRNRGRGRNSLAAYRRNGHGRAPRLDGVAYIRFASVYRDFGKRGISKEFASTVQEAPPRRG